MHIVKRAKPDGSLSGTEFSLLNAEMETDIIRENPQDLGWARRQAYGRSPSRFDGKD
jgi:hypothetical protein